MADRYSANATERGRIMMDDKDYAKVVNEVLQSIGPILDDLKRCLFSRDKRRLNETEKTYMAAVRSSLPFYEAITAKAEKTEFEEKSLAILPSLQRLGIGVQNLLNGVRTTVEAEIPFTDKALAEISEIMALTKDLARDTNDAMLTKNPHFKQYVATSAEHIFKRTDDCVLGHQERLIKGICSPKSSFVYLDIMMALKRIARELADLSEKAQ
jgi:Na+/phosphate symporter